MKPTVLAILALLGTLVVAPSLASADEFVCRRSIGAIALDNVLVPRGATCNMTNTRIGGNIVVKSGATLNAAGIRVEGNIQSEGAALVAVFASDRVSRVGGSVQIEQGGRALVRRVVIEGDLQAFSNRGFLNFRNNSIGGNLQAVSNRGGVFIFRNVIEGALQCKQNFPAPTGGGNDAGDKEGQCARL